MKFNPDTMYLVVDKHPSADLRLILGTDPQLPLDKLKGVLIAAMRDGSPVESSKELRFLLETTINTFGEPVKLFLICSLNNQPSGSFTHTLFIKGVLTEEEYESFLGRKDVTHLLSSLRAQAKRKAEGRAARFDESNDGKYDFMNSEFLALPAK